MTDKTISISEALFADLIDSYEGIASLAGEDALRMVHQAEDFILDDQAARLMDGNVKVLKAGGPGERRYALTPSQRRNILHTQREKEFVDDLIRLANRNGARNIYTS